MPGLQGFPHCCGCDIISGFACKPTDVIEYKRDPNNLDRWGNPLFALDEQGKKIPLKTAKEGLVELIATKSSWGDTKGIPDRGFLCILAEYQMKDWLPTLKELGFIFLCQWNNSVHEVSPNYLFALVKNNGENVNVNPLETPKGWADLPEPDPKLVKLLYETRPEYLNNNLDEYADEGEPYDIDGEYYDDYDM